MRLFAKTFAIAFGITLGVLAAGGLAFGGYSIYRALDDRRAEEQAAVAAARRAEASATVAVASTTATAIKLAAMKCDDGNKLKINAELKAFQLSNSPGVEYRAGGIVRNTCNYDIDFKIELAAVSVNGSTIIATKTIAIDARGEEASGAQTTRVRPGEERLFSTHMTMRPQPDVGSIRATPIIVREGSPP